MIRHKIDIAFMAEHQAYRVQIGATRVFVLRTKLEYILMAHRLGIKL